jgi:hypothetical protein
MAITQFFNQLSIQGDFFGAVDGIAALAVGRQ